MFGNPVTNEKGWDTQPIKVVAPEYTPVLPAAELYWCLNLDMIESYSGTIIKKICAPKLGVGNSTSAFDTSMVLYSKLRPYLNKVVVPDDCGYATTELVGLKPNEKVLNKHFLFNILRSDDFVSFSTGLSGGSRMPRMPVAILRDFPCILPPMDMQEKFVALSQQTDKSKLVALQATICIKNMLLYKYNHHFRRENNVR